MRYFQILLLLGAAALSVPSHAVAQAPGLNALPQVEFARLSQRDPNPLGTKALAIHPEQWKHAETEHFIYHFVDSFVASAIAVEAEFNYRIVVKELQRDPAGSGAIKSHVYIFQKPADWQQFQSAGRLEPWTGGIQSQGSLFIVRDPSFKFSDNSLGHEIVHLVIHRYYPDGIPCWLNEGFAQYVSKAAQASFLRARNYIAKPLSNPIAREKFIPLATLTTMSYPPSAQVETFYEESERLVRFLAAGDKAAFLTFLDAAGKHQPFDSALAQSFGSKFSSASALEEKFREYASNAFGTSSQQAGLN
ncbi:MAG TPA: hypothetical protein VM940_14815 [Chthoniobacterales bacterium]|jgi:hypothetical protein|nr:hypothetical protein [Chthoniobacterales bacterium]